ncbi:hypothetical protein Tco_1073618 [Tanacetum coccineum]
MVTCLEKSEENVEFHQIVDFLSTCSINYALTVSPTIYASYIEQFWNTATSKTINSVKQIHAIIDGKAVVISESSVRSDLLFNGEDGVTCLANDEIFENLALMGYEQLSTKLTFQKGNITPLFASMLVQNQAPEGEGSAIHPEPQPTPSTSQPNVPEPQTASLHIETSPTVAPQTKAHQTAVSQIVFHEAHIEQILTSPTTYQRKRKTQKRRRTRNNTVLPQTSVPLDHGADEAVHKERVIVNRYRWQSQALRNHGGTPAQTRSERVLEQPNEPPLSEGHASRTREGRMEHTFELTDNVPSTPHDSPLPRERKGCSSCRDPQPKEKSQEIGKKKEAKHLTPKKEEIQINKDFEELDDHMKNVKKDKVDATKTRVSTAAVTISTAEPRTPPSSITVFDDEDVTMAMVQTLIKMKEQKAKEKGVTITDVEDSSVRPVRSITTLQPLQTIDTKDKGKGVLVEEEHVKIKMRDQGDLQIQAHAELAQRLHEEELAEL